MAHKHHIIDTRERKLTQPSDWWDAWQSEAESAGLTLSAWVGERCNEGLPRRVRKRLSERRAVGRPRNPEVE